MHYLSQQVKYNIFFYYLQKIKGNVNKIFTLQKIPFYDIIII